MHVENSKLPKYFVRILGRAVVVGLSFRLLLPPDGPFDGILTGFGWVGQKPFWLADPDLDF
ncbi:hypothetical protein [Nesterenkonia ebinurensis]|uniref:hypothetical protein n=1 Tax=Nesterenkonia ebinurensis TaxID=2608252 RepID=UPI00295E3C2A|nr:hypothetical protein [Nesterenkonia ebinurensis]